MKLEKLKSQVLKDLGCGILYFLGFILIDILRSVLISFIDDLIKAILVVIFIRGLLILQDKYIG